MNKLETLVSYGKYSAGAYADALLSIPIAMGNGIVKATGFLCDKIDKEHPAWASIEHIENNSPIYKKRQKLRDSLDTRAGAVYLQSNFFAGSLMLLVGMPAAQMAQAAFVEPLLKGYSKIVQCLSNSAVTLSFQMVLGYGLFMSNEIRANKHKYQDEDGSYSLKKICKGLKTAVKTFLPFDATYASIKTAGQTMLLFKGKDPWKASGLADCLAFPLFYLITIPLGLHFGMIEAEKPDVKIERHSLETIHIG